MEQFLRVCYSTRRAAFSLFKRDIVSVNTQSYSSLASKPTIAVGLSGGVDSAVAALLLKQQGHDVVGVFMRNWDEGEERGNQNCSVEQDLQDAHAVAKQLDIPLHEADFVKTYWTEVFTDFVAECGRGLTPNPDLACNRHIKFDALVRFSEGLGADTIATGHYARLRRKDDGHVQLLRGIDRDKDQSYFLASVKQSVLTKFRFPVGHLQKPNVRAMADAFKLAPANKRSSAGICFIGRRKFSDFLEQYVSPLPGRFVDVNTGTDIGPCANLTALTHGQRAGIGGLAHRMYVAGKDIHRRIVYVAEGQDNPAMSTRSAVLRTPVWLDDEAPRLLDERLLACQYEARYGEPVKPCTIDKISIGRSVSNDAPVHRGLWTQQAFHGSRYTRLLPQDAELQDDYLLATFNTPAMALTPQQAMVLYQGEVCLGSALVAQPGASEFESGNQDEGMLLANADDRAAACL